MNLRRRPAFGIDLDRVLLDCAELLLLLLWSLLHYCSFTCRGAAFDCRSGTRCCDALLRGSAFSGLLDRSSVESRIRFFVGEAGDSSLCL